VGLHFNINDGNQLVVYTVVIVVMALVVRANCEAVLSGILI